ncbi:hypothetical protein TYRP_011821 [Tyrophagus putrescentiae]|nr:hypothetical protein TYRP_011821 [Tyrophagus putrescentiae]
MQQQRSSSSTVQQQQVQQQQPIIVSPNIVFQQSTVVRRGGGGGGGKNTGESSSNTSSSNQPPPPPPPPPPLILLFAWAIAKERHLENWPSLNRPPPGNAQQVIRFLSSSSSTSNFAQRRILAQGCSLGAYSVATFVDQLKKLQETGSSSSSSDSKKNSREKDSQQSQQSEAEKARQIESALAGIILDSPGVSKALHVGAAQVLVQRPLARRLLRRAIYAYYHSSRRHLWDRLQRIGAIQAANPLRVPLLVLYSRDDQVVSARLVDELIEDWKMISDKEGEKPFSVQAKCWPVSEHVTHLRNFPEEYGAEVDRFLAKLGI